MLINSIVMAFKILIYMYQDNNRVMVEGGTSVLNHLNVTFHYTESTRREFPRKYRIGSG